MSDPKGAGFGFFPPKPTVPSPNGLSPRLERILEDVLVELHKASYTHGAFHSSHEGYAVLKEEVDEMWDDIKKNRIPESRQEAAQVAAMAIRYIMDIK